MASVLKSAYIWTSLILILAVFGAVLASRSEAGRNSCLPSWQPPRCSPRLSRPGSTPL